MNNSVDIELWNIFTFYSLQGSPRDPIYLNAAQFSLLCKDSNINTDKLKSIFHKISLEKRGIAYKYFMSFLIQISKKVFPNNYSIEDSFLRLLMDNVLPFAKRRFPVFIDTTLLVEQEVHNLHSYFEESFSEIFRFYSLNSEMQIKGRNSLSSVSTFGNQSSKTLERESLSSTGGTVGKLFSGMCYADFIKLANDFGFLTSVSLSLLDLGDIYLTAIADSGSSFARSDLTLPSLSLEQFWKAIVFCALRAFNDRPQVSPSNKIKALFQAMKQHIQTGLAHVAQKQSGQTSELYAAALFRASQPFLSKFASVWVAEGRPDYLKPETTSRPDVLSPRELLLRLMTAPTAHGARAEVAVSSVDSSPQEPSEQLNLSVVSSGLSRQRDGSAPSTLPLASFTGSESISAYRQIRARKPDMHGLVALCLSRSALDMYYHAGSLVPKHAGVSS